MIEGLIGFAAGVLLTWPALILLVLMAIFCEYREAHGWVVFYGLVILGICYFFFSIPLMTLAISAAAYIPVGLLWSFWRYKRYVGKRVEYIKTHFSSQADRDYAVKEMQPKNMLGTIVQWILVWPFSVIENLISDVIKAIENLVTTVFKRVYHSIYESAVSELKIKE